MINGMKTVLAIVRICSAKFSILLIMMEAQEWYYLEKEGHQ